MDKTIKCDICDKMFESKKQLDLHKKNEHINKKKTSQSKSKTRTILVAVGVSVVIALGVLFWPQSSSNLIDGIRCDPNEFVNYHVHAHLDIFIDGQAYTIPAGIGIKPNTCLFWMHTHDASGVIHIESPSKMDFTLGQFFSVWGQTFSNTKIFDNVTSDKNTLHVYVNGTETHEDFRNIKINAHDEIVIVFGQMPTSIPSNYEFGGL